MVWYIELEHDAIGGNSCKGVAFFLTSMKSIRRYP